MKLATERTDRPDGRLVLVSRDLTRITPADDIAATLQVALERWEDVLPALMTRYAALNRGSIDGTAFHAEALAAPLPRAWQWLDGSAFTTHGALMQRAYNLPPIVTDLPLMYQGMSHQFLGPTDSVPFPDEADGIDCEGELAIVTGAVPPGTTAAAALAHVRLAVQINDWSLRTIAPVEMKTGFGWIQAKPPCSMAPVAITLDELGPAWADGRITATLEVHINGERLGAVPATDMAFGFHDLIAHAARTRSLCAGTIIGSGTISSPDYIDTGSCCIAERRAIETIIHRAATTPFLAFGDRVAMTAWLGDDPGPLFGSIDQCVVQQRAPLS